MEVISEEEFFLAVHFQLQISLVYIPVVFLGKEA
jgi:hypothetical protein